MARGYSRGYGKDGAPPGPTRAQQLKGTFESGPGRLQKGRGKDTGSDRVVYDPNYAPSVQGKTKGFDYKGKSTGEFKAGANVIDPKTGKVRERMSFDDYLKSTGNRADDPRNWEFHYKTPSSTRTSATKEVSASERKRSAYSGAKRGAVSAAAGAVGKELYEVQKIEYETQGVIQGTEQASAKAKAKGGGRFSSTKVATDVATQQQAAKRRTGRAKSRGGAAFEDPKSQRIA